MPEIFEIEDGRLVRYRGCDPCAVIPDGVTLIEESAFRNCSTLTSAVIPAGVREIGECAFKGCKNLVSVEIPEGVTTIAYSAFAECVSLAEADLPSTVEEIGELAFINCKSLVSVAIPGGVRCIEASAFNGCKALASLRIGNGVREIGDGAFNSCKSLTSVTIPGSVKEIGSSAFLRCTNLEEVVIRDGVETIEWLAFGNCPSLVSIRVPASVKEIHEDVFLNCDELTVVCAEESFTHHYCRKYNVSFLFDYQFEAFHGVIPPGIEHLASPFLADEEKPFLFVSYSHRDREEVLPILKALYESGWRIWYDEGLTIGDRYDETLKAHVRDCAGLLLFVTGNSRESDYIRENELPWAVECGKPVIKCILEQGTDYEIPESSLAAVVSPEGIEDALEKLGGLTRGEPREAKGISVVVNPQERNELPGSRGFACCLYAGKSKALARAVLLEAKNSGCVICEADSSGAYGKWMKYSACLVIFLDRAFLADEDLTRVLTDNYREGKDLAICQLEEIEDQDLPLELVELHKMQWLDFSHGITVDMSAKLARHLEKRGCRNVAVMPSFEYETTKKGIVIKKYTGINPTPRIGNEYGGIPVVEIAKGAFENHLHLRSIIIPDSVEKMGERAFAGCGKLASVVIGSGLKTVAYAAFASCVSLASADIRNGVREIGGYAFVNCRNLTELKIPDSVISIREKAFAGCTGLTSVTLPPGIRSIHLSTFYSCRNLPSVTIPEKVGWIGEEAFENCESLTSLAIPGSVKSIGKNAFRSCKALTSVTIMEGMKYIGVSAFSDCVNLTSLIIPKGIKEIGIEAFEGCESLTSVIVSKGMKSIGDKAFKNCKSLKEIKIPKSVKKIGDRAFEGCGMVYVDCPGGSYAAKYCAVHAWVNRKRIQPDYFEFWEKFYGFLDRFTGFWKRLFGIRKKD